MSISEDYNRNVFINCPFDQEYYPLFRAIVFAVYSAGFKPRSALEVADSTQFRLQKIIDIIKECRYGIHDLSRTEVDAVTHLPRFNMPLELGLFLGAKHFGTTHHKKKNALVLDKEKYRYQRFISDISGQDIESHNLDTDTVIRRIRDWLKSVVDRSLPGASKVIEKYHLFMVEIPALCTRIECTESDLTFADLTTIIKEWWQVTTR